MPGRSRQEGSGTSPECHRILRGGIVSGVDFRTVQSRRRAGCVSKPCVLSSARRRLDRRRSRDTTRGSVPSSTGTAAWRQRNTRPSVRGLRPRVTARSVRAGERRGPRRSLPCLGTPASTSPAARVDGQGPARDSPWLERWLWRRGSARRKTRGMWCREVSSVTSPDVPGGMDVSVNCLDDDRWCGPDGRGGTTYVENGPSTRGQWCFDDHGRTGWSGPPCYRASYDLCWRVEDGLVGGLRFIESGRGSRLEGRCQARRSTVSTALQSRRRRQWRPVSGRLRSGCSSLWRCSRAGYS